MTWTDENGIKYIFNNDNSTAEINLCDYHGPSEIDIPKSVKYQNHDYSIVSIDNKYAYGHRCSLFKSIKFHEDSLVSSIIYVFVKKIKIPPLIEDINSKIGFTIGVGQDCEKILNYL